MTTQAFHGSHEPWEHMLSLDGRMERFDKNTRGLPKDLVEAERNFLIRSNAAVWFTDEESVAEGYADQHERNQGRCVLLANLSFRNPMDLRQQSQDIEQTEAFLSAAHGSKIEVSTMYGLDKGIAHAIIPDSSRVIAHAIALGHDALIYSDTDVYGRSCHTSFVVWDASLVQIQRVSMLDEPMLRQNSSQYN